MTSKKIYILFFIVLLLGTAALIKVNFAFLSKEKPTKYSEEKIIELNTKLKELYNYSDEELEELTISQKEDLIPSNVENFREENNSSSMDTGVSQLSKTEISNLERTYISLLGKKNYEKIILDFNNKRKFINMTSDETENLKYIYETAVSLHNISDLTPSETLQNITNGFKEPRAALIGILNISEKERRSAIICETSLAPTLIDQISINIISDVDENDIFYNEIIADGYIDTNKYLIDFSIGNINLKAYILQNKETNKCKIYTITATNKDNCPYETIKFYKDLEMKN